MKSSRNKDEFGKYWICDECAKAKGAALSESLGITLVQGVCAWCGIGPQMLTPLRDFRWKNGRPSET